MIIATRSDKTPLVFRLAAPITLDAVRACTSTSSTRDALHGGGDDRSAGLAAGAVLLDEKFSRIGDFAQAFAGHFEEADFVRAAETVLDAADDAMGVEAITLEISDGIDDMLDDLGPGQCAGLGDMPDENDGGAAGLGQINQIHAAIAKLRD